MRLLRALAPAACAVLSLRCDTDSRQTRYEFLPEMVDSVPYDAFAPNPNTPDGKTLLAPPAGSIARGQRPVHYGPGSDEAARAGRELTNPILDDASARGRGGALFRTFCTPCHGNTGLGDGSIVPRFPSPPPLTAPRARALPDGQIFHIVTHGQGVMPGHAGQVSADDRWRLVHFIRTLQKGPTP